MITFEYQRVTIADVEWENPSLSATESCKSQDLQDFFYYNPGVPFKNYIYDQ